MPVKDFNKIFVVTSIFLLCGLIVIACAGSSQTSTWVVNKSRETDGSPMITPFYDEENKEIIVSDPVQYIFTKEDQEKIGVAIVPFAQMFFLYRSDTNFEKNLAILNKAFKSKIQVQCTVRQYSGRIISIQ